MTFSATGSDVPTINAAAARVVSAADLEKEYGIKVTLVAVIAAGGLVDLRYTVVDKAKAEHFLHDATSLPALYVESSGAILTTNRPKAHKMTVLDGASYFVLYPNSGGAIQAGTGVSVVIDGLRLTNHSPELTGATDASDRLPRPGSRPAGSRARCSHGSSPAGSGTRRIGAPVGIGAPAGILTRAGAVAPLGAPADMRTVIVTMRSQADLGAIPGGDHAARQQGIDPRTPGARGELAACAAPLPRR